MITNLRNPALKQRHWDSIEQVFDYHFKEDEPLTLGLLNNIDAFDHTEAIEEVSGQASSEASLEGILKKVRTSYYSGGREAPSLKMGSVCFLVCFFVLFLGSTSSLYADWLARHQ